MVKVKKISDKTDIFESKRKSSAVHSIKSSTFKRKSVAKFLPTHLKEKKSRDIKRLDSAFHIEENPLIKVNKKWPTSKSVNNSDVQPSKSPKSGKKSRTAVLPIPLKANKNKDNKIVESVSKVEKSSTIKKTKKRPILKSESNSDIHSPKLKIKSTATKLSATLKPSKNNKNKVDIASKIEVNPLKKSKTKSGNNSKIESKKLTTTILKDLNDKYNIKVEDVKSAVKAVIKLHSENPKFKNQLFDDESFPISLLISCHKIPQSHQRILRIPLRHSLFTPETEVCLIVSEVKGIGNKEHEKHVEHYENLLSKKGVTNIKKIMTVHELRTEYETFEQKLRLADLYDAFLVCGKVNGKVVKKCGNIFYKKKKIAGPVKLQSTELKKHIDKQLSKAYLYLHTKGDCYHVKFGHSKMKVSQIIENFASVVKFLDMQFPGTMKNIKGLQVSAPRSTSIPVYISIENPTELSIKVKAKKANKKFTPKPVKGELTTLLNAEVTVKPSGQVIVTRTNDSSEESN